METYVKAKPLVDNPGVGNGDSVNVYNNSLDCDDADTLEAIETLLDRGVELDQHCI